ncbi:hypothetical protein BC343_16005 [Mucilaginibacter pedocola]|uniref:Fibronectin type-III domain-containing protein n=2 Tax=Mucilaginibacter pedocola TaxID=1792845 RepID=A0A1S9P8U3_9SPHI|nr:hypothetical protein BC343_16005 [Mucilaginibacter pedocola]
MSSLFASAQLHFTDFETATNKAFSFTSDGQVFNITSVGTTFFIQAGYPTTGWSGIKRDNKYIDNSGTAGINKQCDFTISSAAGFRLHSFWLYVSTSNLAKNTYGEVTIIGYSNGVQQFSVTKVGDWTSNESNPTNGYTYFDFKTFGGKNVTGINIDAVKIQTSREISYIGLDAFTWSDTKEPANLATGGVSTITNSSAALTSTVNNVGKPVATEYGVVYGTAFNPTTANSKVTNTGAIVTGQYTATINGLTPGVTYYARPYAVNETGTAYGTTTSFTTKKDQTITFAPTATKTYGGADFDPAASVPGALPITYTSSDPTIASIVNNKVHIIKAGTVTITASQPGNAAYMPAENVSQTLTIDKAVLTYTANAASRNYNQADPAFSGTLSGFVNGDNEATATTGTIVYSTTANSTSPAGAIYPIAGSGLSAANYIFAQAVGNANAFTINKGVVTYKVTQVTRPYGQDNPTFAVTYTGLANGETIEQAVGSEIIFSSVADKSSLPGVYAVTTPAISAANYTFVPYPGNPNALIVKKAELTFVAQPATRQYGDPNPPLTGKLVGFVNGDTQENSTVGFATYYGSPTERSPVGNYSITGLSLLSSKYTFVQAPENSTALTITKRALYYTAKPFSRAFNTTPGTALTGTLTGFANYDTQANATTGTLTFSADVDINSPVGTYAITGSGVSATNYDIQQAASNASAYSIYLSSNGNLSNLVASEGTLSPVFAPETNSYTISVPNTVSSITLTPTLSDANAQVKVNDAEVTSGSPSQVIALAVGDNAIHVNVTAQDGTTTNPYTVTVNRPPSSDASLSALAVGGTGVSVSQDPNLSNRFTGTVAKDITSYTVTATVNEPNAKLYIDGTLATSGNTVTLPLAKGDNSVVVDVLAQDGVTHQYQYIYITRAFSDIKTLASLNVSAGALDPVFNSNVDTYTLAVSNTTPSVVFTAVSTDTLATLSQDGLPFVSSFTKQLPVGITNFPLTVRAENGDFKTYDITVTRAVSTDATLATLGINTTTGAIETFDPATLTYNTTVAYNVNTLQLKPVATNDAATIKVNGVPLNPVNGYTYTFNYFSSPETIQIEVTAGDGSTTQTYNVVVTREMSDNNLLANLEVTDLTNNFTISPDFDPNVDTYNLAITDPGVQFIYVKPTKGESHQEVRVNYGAALVSGGLQSVNLNSGPNTIGVRVRSHQGTAKLYTINVTRAYSAVADMSYLTLSQNVTGGFSQFFNNITDTITTSVPNSIDSLSIAPGPADAGASSTVNDYPVPYDQASPKMALAAGSNSFKIGVISADKSATKYYTLVINRLPFTDVTLSGLTGDKGIFNYPFSPERTSYNVTVGSADEYFTLTPVANSANAVVTVNNDTISVAHPSYTNTYPLNEFGNTLFRTVVKAADGVTSKTYSVRVTRQSADVAALSGIGLSSGSVSPAFTAANNSYSASVGYEVSSINFTPKSAEASAVVTVTANGNTTSINGSTPYAAVALALGENVITSTVASLDGNSTQTYTVTVVRGNPSADATLANLGVNSRLLDQAFDSATQNYTLAVPYSAGSLGLAPTATDAHATIKINGNDYTPGPALNFWLSASSTPFTIAVTAQDGTTTKTYTLVANKQPAHTDATLASLSVEGVALSPVFAPETTSYTATVDEAVTSARVFAAVNDAYAHATINYLPIDTLSNGLLVPLNVGLNTVTVRSRAEDNTTKTYTVTIRRGAAPNVNLASITTSVGTLDPVFDPETTEYMVALADTVNEFDISANTADPNAQLAIYGESRASGAPITLSPNSGDNIIDVKVTSADGTASKTYNVNFKKALSGNANLAGVFLVSGSDFLELPDFDPAVYNYTVDVPNAVEYGEMYPYPQAGGVSMTINGANTDYVTSALNEGDNIFVIVVTSENGNATKTYTINIKRAFSTKANLASLITTIGTLEPIFNADTLNYMVQLNSGENMISIAAIPADPNATVNVNYSGGASGMLYLNPGDNVAPIEVTSADGTLTKTYTITVKKPKDTNAGLQDLYFDNSTTFAQVPGFDQSLRNFTMDVPNSTSSVRLVPFANSQFATIKINGQNYNGYYGTFLRPGANVYIIEVTAQDGIAKETYTLTINRGRSTNNNLYTLQTTAGTLSPAFDKDVLSYSLTVPANTATIGLTAQLSDTTARVSINGEPKQTYYYQHQVALAYGSNTFTVTTSSASGADKVYTIIITRTPASSIATLSALSTSSGSLSPAFNPNTLNYTAAVSSNTASVTITAKVTDTKAKISINGIATADNTPSAPIALVAGINPISVIVTAEDGTLKTYTVNVKRAASAIATLNKLYLVEPAVTKTNVATGPGDYNSTAAVTASTKTIKVVAVATDSTATIRVNGIVTASGAASAPVTLTADSTFITIQVTAANNTTIKNYVIKVTKPLSAVATLSKLYLVEPAVEKTNTSTGPGDFNSTATVAAHVNSIKVVAVATDAGATIRVNGVVTASGAFSDAITLSGTATDITVEVTAPNGIAVKTYVIKVNKDVLSSVAALSKLYLVSPAVTKTNVSSGPADYNSTASVYATTKTIKVVAVATDTTATIRINGVITASGVASAPVTLNVGQNTINVVVTAQNGTTTRSWAIIVTKPAPVVIATTTPNRNQVDIIQKPEPLTTETLPEAITVKQAVSPNGDGINDRFTIEGITAFPENKVQVMNRNGEVVYEAKGYDNLGTAFDGHGSKGTMQQPGTYFYSIEYKKEGQTIRKTGYLVLKY